MGLILAAGMGTRLGDSKIPKCLLEINNTSIMDYQLRCFKKIGINDIVMIVGQNSDMIKKHASNNVKLIYNLNYKKTNNLYSIWEARDSINDDFVCIYSDLLFHIEILKSCIASNSNVCLMVEKKIREETMRVEIKENRIVQVNKIIPFGKAGGNFIGMAKFRKNEKKLLFNEIEELIKLGNKQAYYTRAIEKLIEKGRIINYAYTKAYPWVDIDTMKDLSEARLIFHDLKEVMD